MDFVNVREQVTDRLRVEILLGRYEPGEALREIPLAERYKVSRGPIRDAFLQLAQQGLLDLVPNRGVRIGKVWDASMLPVMAKLRFDLESFAMGELMDRPPQDLKDKLNHNLRMFKLACEDEDMMAIVQLDLAFHRMFLRDCGHAGLESVWLPLLGGFRLPYSRHRMLTESSEEHQYIADAILDRRKKDAIEGLKRNILHPFTKR
jgi:DNA-binding GntR family transcriptional regulator